MRYVFYTKFPRSRFLRIAMFRSHTYVRYVQILWFRKVDRTGKWKQNFCFNLSDLSAWIRGFRSKIPDFDRIFESNYSEGSEHRPEFVRIFLQNANAGIKHIFCKEVVTISNAAKLCRYRFQLTFWLTECCSEETVFWWVYFKLAGFLLLLWVHCRMSRIRRCPAYHSASYRIWRSLFVQKLHQGRGLKNC